MLSLTNQIFGPWHRKKENKYLKIDGSIISELMRNIVPFVLEEKDEYRSDKVFEGNSIKILIFANYTFFESNPEKEWRWKSCPIWKKKTKSQNEKSDITMNPLLYHLKIPIQKFIHYVIQKIQKEQNEMRLEQPSEGTLIGVENRLCLVNESEKNNAPKLDWHVDSDGFVGGDCWTTIVYYTISASIQNGILEFLYSHYQPKENEGIIFEKNISHRVNPIYSTRGVSFRGSLQLFFTTGS